jgi:hypothetical protein
MTQLTQPITVDDQPRAAAAMGSSLLASVAMPRRVERKYQPRARLNATATPRIVSRS